MPISIAIYLAVIGVGFYLIGCFFTKKALVNLVVGVGIIFAPAVLVIMKLLGAYASQVANFRVGLVAVAALFFGMFAYLSLFVATALRAQWKQSEGLARPSPGDLVAYAFGVGLLILFGIFYMR